MEISRGNIGPELEAWIHRLPAAFDEGGEVLHLGRNTVKRFAIDGRNVVVKRFHRYRFVMRLVRTLGHSEKARNAFDNAQQLRRLGFATPEPLAAVVFRGLGGITDSYYISAETLNPPIKQGLGSDDWDHSLAEAYGRFVAQLHVKGVLHRDLNITNVLWEKRGGVYCFELIDLNRMTFYREAIEEDECLENLTLFTGRMDLFTFVAEHYAAARDWDWSKVDRAVKVKKVHDAMWRRHQRLKHPFRKAMVLLLLVLQCAVASAQCDVEVKRQDRAAYDKALQAYADNHLSEANSLLKKVVARNPKSADTYFYLGMVAARQDLNPAAIRKYFTRCIELCPDYPNALAHYYMGVIHYSDNRFEDAVVELNRYFDMANNSGNAAYEAVYAEASSYLHWSQFLAEAELNKAPFNPSIVRGISSKEDELLPYLAWDQTKAFFLRMVPLAQEKTFYTRQSVDKVLRMMESRRDKNGNFSTGEPMPAPFNQHDDEGGVSLTADNGLLFYSMVTRGRDGYGNCDIYYSEFRGGSWTEIQNAGQQVNGEKSWDSQPSISPDGNTLYFASNRKGGQGGTDIWRCRRLPNGDWSRAENLGPSVNTAGNEKCPFIHADGHTLYFASDGWQGFGGYDMYFTNLNDASAAYPTNMGLPINTENDDICFGVTADGAKAYYAGKHPEGESVGGRDVYMFELYPAARPEPMKVIRCGVFDMDMHPIENSRLVVKRYGADDAVYKGDVMMLSLKEDNIIVADAEGFIPKVNCYDVKRVKNMNVDNDVWNLDPLKAGEHADLVQISFDSGKKALSPVSKKILDQYVIWLQAHPMVHVEVQSRSLLLSQAIYDYFVSQKLRKERLSVGNNISENSARITIKKI